MKKNVQVTRKTGWGTAGKTGAKRRGREASAAPGRQALALWRTIQDRLLQQKLNSHLQGLYAELGKLYFEHLRKIPRLPLRKGAEAGELSARIAEFRKRQSGLEPRRKAARRTAERP